MNTAFRLKQIAHGGQVLIGENMYQFVKNDVSVSEPFATEIKGKAIPLKVYELLGMRLLKNLNDL